jgi:hypothetical protein
MINYEVGPMADVPPTPADLMAPGRRLWAAVVGKYVLTPTELLILEEAARTADELSRLERAVRNLSRMTAAGSAGQTVAPSAADRGQATPRAAGKAHGGAQSAR